MKKILMICLPALTLLSSCTEHYLPEQIEIIQLGATKKVITLPDEEQGEDQFEVYANCDWDYVQISGNDWLTVDEVCPISQKENSYKLHFNYFANNGYDRMARIVLFKDNRRDTLSVRQRGLVSTSISLKSFSGGVIPASGGTYSITVETNALQRDLMVSASDPKQFSELYYSGHKLHFTILPATERDKKAYTLKVYVINGWGEAVEGSTIIYQSAKQ